MRFRTTIGLAPSSDPNEQEDQYHRKELCVNAVAHNTIGVLAVELSAFGKATDSNHQNPQNKEDGEPHDDK